MKKYPSIQQFRNVIRTVRERHDYIGRDSNEDPVYYHSSDYPILKFQGTVKLHGTNAGIVFYNGENGRTEFQSRENVLSLEKDNAGFMRNMSEKDLSFLYDAFDFQDSLAIYGEWCGSGIQKGVAITELPKMFVIFGVKVDDKWVDLPKELSSNEQGIYNILQFPTYEIDIDFNQPELSQNALINMTLEVENECPVGKFFGISGVGEGIVFTCTTNQDYKFKSKGEKHSVTKVKVLNNVNVEDIQNINEFVESVLTEQRLKQGLDYLKENHIDVDIKNTGQFLGWIVRDVLKEEGDTIKSNNLEEKKVKATIVNKARSWFINFACIK
ncbi:hypothetical protein [Leptolyngbya phage Lbo-JY46]